MSRMHTPRGNPRWNQQELQNFPDTPLPRNMEDESHPHRSVTSRVESFIKGCETARERPSMHLANDARQILAQVWEGEIRGLECSLPQQKKLLATDSISPDCLATFRFIDGDRKCFALLFDDYRNPIQLIVAWRDLTKDKTSALATLGKDHQRVEFNGDEHADSLYKKIGDLHSGGDRLFFPD
jgi:hypothetical protein